MTQAISGDTKRLTANEVAELLGYDVQTIYKWARLGTIPCIRRRRNIRFRLEDIQRWEARATTGKL